MSDIVNNSKQNSRVDLSSLRSRIAKARSRAVLLLDTSYSMEDELASGETRIAKLKEVAHQVPPEVKMYSFSDFVRPVDAIDDLEPGGGTALAEAFNYLKSLRILSVVVVTDGEPNNQRLALEASIGMKVSAVYVGDPPVPGFLEDLVKSRGGSFSIENLLDLQHTLSTIKGLLGSPTPKLKGAIQL